MPAKKKKNSYYLSRIKKSLLHDQVFPYSLLSVAQLLGEITLKSFIFISYHRSCYLCRLHKQKNSPSYMSEPPLKRRVANPFLKKLKKKKKVFPYREFLNIFQSLNSHTT